jgi:hypothetical protein
LPESISWSVAPKANVPAVVIGEGGLVIVATAENAGTEPLAASPCGLARPKSINLAPLLVSMILPGFKSRWITP